MTFGGHRGYCRVSLWDIGRKGDDFLCDAVGSASRAFRRKLSHTQSSAGGQILVSSKVFPFLY